MGSDDYASHYAAYYGSAELTAWRELGARDKATNIVTLWEAAGVSTPPRIIDIGCGEGALVSELARRGFGASFLGVEVSASGVQCARRRSYPSPAGLVQYDGARIPCPDRSFDLAVLSHVVEHVESPRLLLREAARVARHVFVEVPLELHARTPRDFQWTDLGHVNLYSALLIRHLVQSVGLTVLAEKVTLPCKEAMTYRRPGLRSELRYHAMAALLAVAPGLACRLWTYHGSLVARSP